jgi:hypothetical protein
LLGLVGQSLGRMKTVVEVLLLVLICGVAVPAVALIVRGYHSSQALEALRLRAIIPTAGKYPKAMYHATLPPVSVRCPDEEYALGEGWFSHPAEAQASVRPVSKRRYLG